VNPVNSLILKKFVAPIMEYLATLGIKAHIGKTNDIRIGELKVSGNAEHVYKKRVLHHGTLLFNSDLEQLREAIKVTPGKYIE
jgi:lipoate-protein ligase A